MSDGAVRAGAQRRAERPGADGSDDGSAQRDQETGREPAEGRAQQERVETPVERADRNMIEMLQELRVAQTGVQILFAFLLSLSFTERFGSIDDTQRWIYVVTLLLTAVTTGLLVAPASIHRMLFGQGVKPVTVRIGHRLFVAGLGALALTLVGAVLLVLDVTVGRRFAIPVAAAVGVFLVVLWFVVPLPMRRRGDREDVAAAEAAGERTAPN
jgi:hypothetical protein